MFKPHKDICVKCAQEKLVVVKAGLCKQCNERHKNAKKELLKLILPLKTIDWGLETPSSKRAKRPRSTGELSVFKEIWEERPHVCQVTEVPLHHFDIRCFSHILPKSVAPKYRLLKENIKLVTPEIHHEWDFGDRHQQKFDWVREKAQMLRQQYNAL